MTITVEINGKNHTAHIETWMDSGDIEWGVFMVEDADGVEHTEGPVYEKAVAILNERSAKIRADISDGMYSRAYEGGHEW